MKNFEIPKEVTEIISALMNGGYEAHIVGGCVRDLLLKRESKDWDIATGARPEEIQIQQVKVDNAKADLLDKIGNSRFSPSPDEYSLHRNSLSIQFFKP